MVPFLWKFLSRLVEYPEIILLSASLIDGSDQSISYSNYYWILNYLSDSYSNCIGLSILSISSRRYSF